MAKYIIKTGKYGLRPYGIGAFQEKEMEFNESEYMDAKRFCEAFSATVTPKKATKGKGKKKDEVVKGEDITKIELTDDIPEDEEVIDGVTIEGEINADAEIDPKVAEALADAKGDEVPTGEVTESTETADESIEAEAEVEKE